MENQKTKGLKKALRITSIVLFTVLAAVLALMLVTVAVFKRGPEAPSLFGYRFFYMQDAAMGDAVPNGSLVTAKVSDSEEEIGSVLYYKDGNGMMSVGRIISKSSDSGRLVYSVKSDLGTEEALVPEKDVAARVTGVSVKLGKLLGFALSYKGVFFIAVLPCALLVLFEIIFAVGRSKKGEESTKEITPEEAFAPEAEPEATGKYAEKSLTNELSELKKDEPDSEEDADDVVLLKQGEAADLFAKAAQENEEAPQADEASVRQ